MSVATAPPRAAIAGRGVELRLAGPGDAAGIAELLAEPMPGAVRLALGAPPPCPDERRHAVVVVDREGRVLAHGARTVRLLRVRGASRRVGYLWGLRRRAELAGGGRLLARGLGLLARTRAEDEADHDLTSVLAGNARALRVLTRLPEAPAYRPIGGYRTWMFAARTLARLRCPAPLTVASPGPGDVAAVQALVDGDGCDYRPPADVAADPASWLVAGDGAAPVAALRLTRRGADPLVAGYAPPLAAGRHLVNLGLRVARRPTLPPAGTAIAALHTAHLTVAAGHAAVLAAVLAAAGRAALERGLQRVAVGLAAGHPLRMALDRLPSWGLDSELFAVGGAPAAGLASPEAALL